MNPKKFRNSAGKPSKIVELVAVRCSTRHPTGSAWIHASSPMKSTKLVDREHLLLLCLPTPAARVTVTCNKKKKRTNNN